MKNLLFLTATVFAINLANAENVFQQRPDAIIDCKGVDTYKVFTGDVNNDGKQDILVCNHPSGKVKEVPNGLQVYFQKDAKFGTEPDLQIAVPAPWGVVVKDINSDGKNDLAVSTYSKALYRCYAANNFKSVKFMNTNMRSFGLLDMNLNSSLKEKFSVSLLSRATWWRIAKDGTVKSSYILRPPKNQSGLPATGDINDDGEIDLVYPQDQRLLVYYGPFVPTPLINPEMLSEHQIIDIAEEHGKIDQSGITQQVVLGDFNTDSRMDIAALTSKGILFFHQASPMGFAQAPSKILKGSFREIKSVDLNNDGLMDIVTIDQDLRKIRIFLQQSAGGFAESIDRADQIISLRDAYSLTFSGINTNCSKDMLVAGARGYVYIFYNQLKKHSNNNKKY